MKLSIHHQIKELFPFILFGNNDSHCHHHQIEELVHEIVLLYPPAIKFPITCKGAFGPVVQMPT